MRRFSEQNWRPPTEAAHFFFLRLEFAAVSVLSAVSSSSRSAVFFAHKLELNGESPEQ
jgi:hypothetical protein